MMLKHSFPNLQYLQNDPAIIVSANNIFMICFINVIIENVSHGKLRVARQFSAA